MKAAFADTFYWIALTFPGDAFNDRVQGVTSDLVTTDEVLTEYLTFFSKTPERLRRQAAANVQAILDDPAVLVVPQSRDSFLAGLELFRTRPDKGYSLTDCISMWTMRREGLTDALTNDRHFEQEGFRAVFREP